MSNKDQPRHGPGVPIGGQFRERVAAPADDSVVLIDPTDDLFADSDPWAALDLFEQPAAEEKAPEPEPTPEPEPAPQPAGEKYTPTAEVPGDEVDWAEIQELSRVFALRYVTSSGLGDAGNDIADDIAQEVTVSLLKQQANVRVSGAFVRTAARGLVARAWHSLRTTGGIESLNRSVSSDMKAWRILSERRAEFEEATGKAMSTRQIAKLAEQIRNEWEDQNRKPNHEFYRDFATESISGWNSDEDDSDRDNHPYAAAVATASTEEIALNQNDIEGAFTTAALDAVDQGDGRSHIPMRLAHNAIAENRGTPMAQAGVMSQRRITHARKVVGITSEQVLAVVEDWANGVDDERTELLFAPYGELTNAEKTAIADMYRDLAPHAGDLYVSALMFANKRTLGEVEHLI